MPWGLEQTFYYRKQPDAWGSTSRAISLRYAVAATFAMSRGCTDRRQRPSPRIAPSIVRAPAAGARVETDDKWQHGADCATLTTARSGANAEKAEKKRAPRSASRRAIIAEAQMRVEGDAETRECKCG